MVWKSPARTSLSPDPDRRSCLQEEAEASARVLERNRFPWKVRA